MKRATHSEAVVELHVELCYIVERLTILPAAKLLTVSGVVAQWHSGIVA